MPTYDFAKFSEKLHENILGGRGCPLRSATGDGILAGKHYSLHNILDDGFLHQFLKEFGGSTNTRLSSQNIG